MLHYIYPLPFLASFASSLYQSNSLYLLLSLSFSDTSSTFFSQPSLLSLSFHPYITFLSTFPLYIPLSHTSTPLPPIHLGDPNLPLAIILGPRTVILKSLDALSLRGSGDLSACATSYDLNYTWSLSNSTGYIIPLKSATVDPRTYVLPAYSLTAGLSYVLTLAVSTVSKYSYASIGYDSVGVYVQHGHVIAAVRGGYSRQAAADKPLTLDSSISSDEDSILGGTILKYTWRCFVPSLTDFGSDCRLSAFVSPMTSTSVITLPRYQMTVGVTYSFVVVVRSTDGRSATQTVIVIAQLVEHLSFTPATHRLN